MGTYCPKCKSRLYPGDEDYMDAVNVCSGCVSYGSADLKKRYNAYMDRITKAKKKKKGR
jgi:DNA-directed RNA polymerase subunit M/transcription elongation factor TFIIS